MFMHRELFYGQLFLGDNEMDPTSIASASTGATSLANSSTSLGSVDTALANTQSMMNTAAAQQQQMNQMKMQFDGVMSQLAMQSSIEEKLTTTMEKQSQAIAQ
jgi:hypothetical protein